MQELDVFIFSYNRGQFLLNCARSAQRHLPDARITIVDDNSTDPETGSVLSQLGTEMTVVNARSETTNLSMGGFYSNLQLAVDELAQRQWAMFITDDMQFVRPFEDLDREHAEQFFAIHPHAALLMSLFSRSQFENLDRQCSVVDERVPVYFRTNEALAYTKWGVHFNVVGLFHIDRLRAAGYQFGDTPETMRANAQRVFSSMGYSPFPVMANLPFAPSTKHRVKTQVYRLVERWYQAGYYPYQDMTPEAVDALRTRDLNVMPVADQFLEMAGANPGKPFHFEDSIKRAPQWIRYLDHFERRCRTLTNTGR